MPVTRGGAGSERRWWRWSVAEPVAMDAVLLVRLLLFFFLRFFLSWPSVLLGGRDPRELSGCDVQSSMSVVLTSGPPFWDGPLSAASWCLSAQSRYPKLNCYY